MREFYRILAWIGWYWTGLVLLAFGVYSIWRQLRARHSGRDVVKSAAGPVKESPGRETVVSDVPHHEQRDRHNDDTGELEFGQRQRERERQRAESRAADQH